MRLKEGEQQGALTGASSVNTQRLYTPVSMPTSGYMKVNLETVWVEPPSLEQL